MIHLMLPFFPFLLAIHYAVRILHCATRAVLERPGYLDYDARVIMEPRQTDLRRHTGGQELLSNSPDRPGDPRLLSELYMHNSPYL
ncbi:hypothetical protein C8R47DRAFT_1090757, partial [Mycena vitilis]